MTSARRSAPTALVAILAVVAVLAPAAGAAGATAQPESGPLSPAFVEALHDPLVTVGLGRVPSPVEVEVGAAAETAAARRAEPSSYDLRNEGRLPRRPRPGRLGHLLGVRQRRRAGVQAPPRRVARLQRGQPDRPQRLRLHAGMAVRLRRLRLHGRRLLRPLGRPRRGDGRPVRHVGPADGQHRAEARAGRRHDPGAHGVERQRHHQAARARERRAQRRHVLGGERLQRASGRHGRHPAGLLPGRQDGREPRRGHRGLGRPVPCGQLRRRLGPAAGSRARSSCATAGAPAGATAATSGSPTSTARSPAIRGWAATAEPRPTPPSRAPTTTRASTSTTTSA